VRKSLERWRSRREQGFARFVLNWGVIRFGTTFVIAGAVSLAVSMWLLRRQGVMIDLQPTDFVTFGPRLLVIALVGGVALAVLIWFVAERSYRKALQESAGA
jgi:peptidoglycan biosynthesis protein MviN/MurJ (putative lipid II flippase)